MNRINTGHSTKIEPINDMSLKEFAGMVEPGAEQDPLVNTLSEHGLEPVSYIRTANHGDSLHVKFPGRNGESTTATDDDPPDNYAPPATDAECFIRCGHPLLRENTVVHATCHGKNFAFRFDSSIPDLFAQVFDDREDLNGMLSWYADGQFKGASFPRGTHRSFYWKQESCRKMESGTSGFLPMTPAGQWEITSETPVSPESWSFVV